MAASTTLTRLLRDLKAVSSPLERMRVAARAWRSLRRLRPEERQILATQVGLEGAEEILQGLGRGEKRLAPVLVLRALEKAKKADPSQLRDLVKGLRDRDKRGTILQKWLDSASEGLEDEGAEVIQEAQAEATSEESVKSPSPAQREKTPPAPNGTLHIEILLGKFLSLVHPVFSVWELGEEVGNTSHDFVDVV